MSINKRFNASYMTNEIRGSREPGNMTLQRGRIFGLVLFKRKVTDQEGRPAGQRQSGAGAGRIFLVLFRIIEQDQELVKKIVKSHLLSF